jgi:16S rRNA (guanine527-N7)-methyltransferase
MAAPPPRDSTTAKPLPLQEAAETLGIPVHGVAMDHLRTWLDQMLAWNARVDLTAARSGDELVDLMVADALVLSRCLPSGARLVDVGTGAGAPGLALALLRPDLRVTLVEPLLKRVSFLRTVLGTTGRTDIELRKARMEDVLASGETWDVATARATFAPPQWLEFGARIVNPQGEVCVLLAREAPPALDGWSVREDSAYTWPRTGASRRLVRYHRSTLTP